MLFPILRAIVLGAVEGVTEFLPISSTGHLILVNQWISFGETFTKMFDVVIQLGAILAVIVLFWGKLWPFGREEGARREIFSVWQNTIIALVPAVIIGSLLGDLIEEKLFNPWVVAAALVIGGLVLIFIEKIPARSDIDSVSKIPWRTALSIGLIQCLALIPGTSRAAATIVGARLLGASRSTAVELSFFLAIPTMVAASAYSIIKRGAALSGPEIFYLIVGFLSAFFVALAVIRFFMKYIREHDFKAFGYYRIALGALVAAYFLLNK